MKLLALSSAFQKQTFFLSFDLTLITFCLYSYFSYTSNIYKYSTFLFALFWDSASIRCWQGWDWLSYKIGALSDHVTDFPTVETLSTLSCEWRSCGSDIWGCIAEFVGGAIRLAKASKKVTGRKTALAPVVRSTSVGTSPCSTTHSVTKFSSVFSTVYQRVVQIFVYCVPAMTVSNFKDFVSLL